MSLSHPSLNLLSQGLGALPVSFFVCVSVCLSDFQVYLEGPVD